MIPNLKSELAKQIIWHPSSVEMPSSKIPQQTEYSIVFLHGFSASHREISPVPEKLAEYLGSHLYLARLTGHAGHSADLGEAKMEDWLQDAGEALEIGKCLGKKIIIIAVSTSVNLALWLAKKFPERIASAILLSPNFGVKDKRSEILLWPGGLRLLKWIVGPEHSFTPQNSNHEKYWTTHYPIEALKEMMRLVRWSRNQDLSQIRTPFLFLTTPYDAVIDLKSAKQCFDRLGSIHKEWISLPQAKHHVMAGDILSPYTNTVVLESMIRFLNLNLNQLDKSL